MNKKLIVLFPGVGYHNDKPLMYYTKKIAKKHDYEIVEIYFDFSDVKFIKGDSEAVKMAIDAACSQAVEQLKGVTFSNYDRVVFVGKSIGTAVMARYSAECGVNAEMIVFTPIAETFDYPGINGPVFHGSEDPLCDTDLCVRLCEDMSLTCTVIPGANHSLETGDVETDISNLGKVMVTVENCLG